ncbi:MAG: alpha/beta hydrolase family protein, partial [Rhodanobacter sp.]
MSYRFAQALLGVACLLIPLVANASNKIPVEDFARHGQLSQPRLSPDGQHIAVAMADASGYLHALVIYKVNDMTVPVSTLRMPKYELPAGIKWVSNTRLVVLKGKLFGSVDKPTYTGEIIATDLDGTHQDYLYGYNNKMGKRGNTRGTDRGWGSFDGMPSPADGHFYMSTVSWDGANHSELYNVDAIKNTRHLIGDISVAGMNFMVGADGKARYAYGTNNDYEYVVYRQQGNGWAKMTAEQVGGSFTPVYFSPDQQHIYALYDREGGPVSLIEQDAAGTQRKVLAKDSFSSIGDVQWTALPQQPFATTLATGRPVVNYIDPNLPAAKLHMALSQKFPGSMVRFLDYSEDGSVLMFSVYSDRAPSTYYLIGTHDYKVSKLFSTLPWVDPAQMAERRPIRFKASDGMELEAILTLPKGAPEGNLPMVLLPHGGPIDVQDDWSYDNDAQFLASRGYLVLQVNYRGSGGRGVDFKEAGYLNWGTRIQQDLIDGVAWAVAENYA